MAHTFQVTMTMEVAVPDDFIVDGKLTHKSDPLKSGIAKALDTPLDPCGALAARMEQIKPFGLGEVYKGPYNVRVQVRRKG